MITARLHSIVQDDPNAIALIAGGRRISYAELWQAIGGVRLVLEKKGVKAGDVVMVSLPYGWETVAAFFACAAQGAVFLAVNPAWHKTELAWLLTQAPPRTVILSSRDTERWLDAGLEADRILLTDLWERLPADPPFLHVENWPADHPAACMVSSGSLGHPKLAIRTQGAVLKVAAGVSTVCALGRGDRLLATVPWYHAYGLANNLILPLLNGATLVLQEHFDPVSAAGLIQRHAVSYLISSPLIFGLLIDSQTDPQALRSLRVCLSGGAPLAEAVRHEWLRRFGVPIRQAYGSTEAGLIAIQSEDSADSARAGACVGSVIPGNQVRILSGDVEAAAGETGEVAVQGPGVVTRYLGEVASPSRLWNGFVRTGDLGWMDESGKLFLAGRLRPWINAGGVKIDPEEVQRVLRQIPGVRDCAVTPEPGPGGFDIVGAVIAVESGGQPTRADVIRHCRTHLAEFKIPRVIRFVAAAAVEPTGKWPQSWAAPPAG